MHDLQKLKKQKNIFFALFSRLLRSSRTNVFQLFQRLLSVVISHSLSDIDCQIKSILIQSLILAIFTFIPDDETRC